MGLLPKGAKPPVVVGCPMTKRVVGTGTGLLVDDGDVEADLNERSSSASLFTSSVAQEGTAGDHSVLVQFNLDARERTRRLGRAR